MNRLTGLLAATILVVGLAAITTESRAAQQREPYLTCVYKSYCAGCHDTGRLGAPIAGDTAAWAPRIAKGLPTLRTHAIEGFYGEQGFMPGKGGHNALSEAEVTSAIQNIIENSQSPI
jgi:cytochrome c5